MKKKNILLLLLLGGTALASCPKNAPVESTGPVDAALIRNYLRRRGVEFAEKDNGVFGYGSGRDTILIRVFPEERMLYLAMPRLTVAPFPPAEGGEDKALALFAAMMYVNRLELAGKLEWDPDTGEAAFSMTAPTADGLGYEAFIGYCKYMEKRGPEVRQFLAETAPAWESSPDRDDREKPDWSPK